MTARSLAAESHARRVGAPQNATAILTVLSSMALVVLDAGMSNVALPNIARSLNVTSAQAIQVTTGYQLGLVVALLPAASLGEILGLRRIFAAGVALFSAASLLSACAPSLQWLVAARFVQGIGGAGVMALGVALLRTVVGSERLGAAIGWNALTVALSSAAGPTLGAAIISVAAWPWLFAISALIGLAVWIAARALPPTIGVGRRVDTISILLNALAFLLLAAGTVRLTASPIAGAAMLLASGLAVLVLIRRSVGRNAPLLPLDLLRQPSFRRSVRSSILCFSGQTCGLISLPFYLQDQLGFSSISAGLHLALWPLAVAAAGPLAGALADRVPSNGVCFAGGCTLALGLAMTAFWPLSVGSIALACGIALCGAGFGLFNVPNNRNMFLSAPIERSAAAGGLQGMARLTGQTAGALAVTVLFGAAGADVAPRMGLAIAAALSFLSALSSIAPGWRRAIE